jgi:hypothetical protein
LFNLASVAAEGRFERSALSKIGPRLERRYRRAYEAGARLDPLLIRRWEVLHAVHGWAQIEYLNAGGFDGESSSAQTRMPAGVVDFLRSRLEHALSDVGG